MKTNLGTGFMLALLSPLTLSVTTAPPATFDYLKNKSVDLRPTISQMGMAVRDQDPRGTCTIFATTFLIEFYTARIRNLKNVDFSEEYLAAAARRASDDKRDNYFFSEAALGYEEYGIVDEKDVPYKRVNPIDSTYLQDNNPATLDLLEKGKRNRLLQSEILLSPNNPQRKPGLSDEQFKRILMELDKQNPVAIGFAGGDGAVFKELRNPYREVMMTTDPNKLNYGHSVPLVGYNLTVDVAGGGYFIYRDSNGTAKGDAGYRYMSFDYVRNYVHDVLILSKTPLYVIALKDRYLIQKRWRRRKDILIQTTQLRSRIRLPFITARNLRVKFATEQRLQGRAGQRLSKQG